MEKLNHINQEHIYLLDPYKRVELVTPFWKELGLDVERHDKKYLAKALELLGGRGQTLKEVAEYSDYLLDFEVVKERYDGKDLTESQKIY